MVGRQHDYALAPKEGVARMRTHEDLGAAVLALGDAGKNSEQYGGPIPIALMGACHWLWETFLKQDLPHYRA